MDKKAFTFSEVIAQKDGSHGQSEAKQIQGLSMFVKSIGIDRLRVKPAMTERFASMCEMEDISCAERTPLTRIAKFTSFTKQFNPLPQGARGNGHITSPGAGLQASCAKRTEKNLSLLTFHFSRKRKRVAFTLAEVLITLGIIGVVAALTLPTLIQNHRNHVVETRLKKFYSAFNQAILFAVNEHGEYANWYPDYVVQADGGTDKDGNVIDNNETITNSFEKYIAPYMKITDKKIIEGVTVYYLADGSAFCFLIYTNRDLVFFPNAKNIATCIQEFNKTSDYGTGSCAFRFLFMPTTKRWDWKYHYNKGLEPYMWAWDGDEASLYNTKIHGCNERGYYCTAIIQHNGWKIPKNYPKKIKF